jgi:exonuclease III
LSISFFVSAQIIIDEDLNDWNLIQEKITDPANDGSGSIDFTEFKSTNDSEYLYLKFNTGKELNLQENSKIILYIDTDNNTGTGLAINGIGADISYDFGQRTGYYHRNSLAYDFYHDDCGLISLPTVTSDNFEMAIKRKFNAGNYLVIFGNKIRIAFKYNVSGGDIIPDQSGAYLYQMNDTKYISPSFKIEKYDQSHLRLMSYNVKQDGNFEDEPPYKRIIKAIQADILCFQEIYNHSAGEMNNKVKSYFGGNWYDAKIGSDIIIVSKYPIINFDAIGGNGAFLINYKGIEILIINVHLYCCDNDSDRQTETDEIMQFISNAKNQTGPFTIKKNTPIIITGDTNFVGLKQQRKTLLQGDIVNETKYGKDFLPDWDNTYFEDAKPLTTGYPGSFTWKSYFSSYPAGRIDYFIYSGSVLKLENSYVLSTDLLERDILDQFQLNNEDSYNASDHLPIVADFSIRDISPTYDNSKQENFINIYPNPASDRIKIEYYSETSGNIEIVIYNQIGQKIKKEIVRKKYGFYIHFLDISDLPTGLYNTVFYSNNSKLAESIKFVKY